MEIRETIIHEDGTIEAITRPETPEEEASRIAAQNYVAPPTTDERIAALENALLELL